MLTPRTSSPWRHGVLPLLAVAGILAPRDNEPPPPDPKPEDSKPPEIDLSQYMPKAVFEKELARRVAAIVGKQRGEDEFLSDEAFRAKALEAWGVKPGEQAKGEDLTGDRLKALQDDWTKKHLDPVKSELGEAKGLVEQLLNRDLTAQILQAAGPLAQEALLTPPVKGAEPPIVPLLRAYFGRDPQSNSWLTKEGEGFAFSANPSADAPYKTVGEFVAEWFEGPGKAFARDVKQRGPTMGGPGGPGGPKKDLPTQIQEAEAAGNFALASQLKAEMLRSR